MNINPRSSCMGEFLEEDRITAARLRIQGRGTVTSSTRGPVIARVFNADNSFFLDTRQVYILATPTGTNESSIGKVAVWRHPTN